MGRARWSIRWARSHLKPEERVKRRSHRSLTKQGRLDAGHPEKETRDHFVETQQTGGDGTARTRREEVRTQVSEGPA